jgi:hypothetical protein
VGLALFDRSALRSWRNENRNERYTPCADAAGCGSTESGAVGARTSNGVGAAPKRLRCHSVGPDLAAGGA